MNLFAEAGSVVPVLRHRRQRLAEQVKMPVLLWSGRSSARNFPANVYPFRASSHFLYFAGRSLENAVIGLEAGKLFLFMDEATPASALWHGETPTAAELAAQMGAEEVYPLEQLKSWAASAATIAAQDAATRLLQSAVLNRMLSPTQSPQGIDAELTQAMIQLRLVQDTLALAEMQRAIAVSMAAHRAGMQATRTAQNESQVRAAMEAVIMAADMTCAYSSIVTVQGEVLHNNCYRHNLHPGDLLLADVGAETETGWASDITRTWPVSGKFSPTQRRIYDVVLAAHDACIAAIAPGVEYQSLHLLAAQVLAAGLVDVGILRGQVEDLVAMDAHALFFPHGIGHILGLDVHDMEDLGDLAGYAAGRQRSDRFGLGYLRLHRPLQAGMVVTIEPGFYQVPAILQDPERRERYKGVVNWERLSEFKDVRGIRIEDDVWVTETDANVLTADLPTQAEAVEQMMLG